MKKEYDSPSFEFKRLKLEFDVLNVSSPEGEGEGGTVQPPDPFGAGAW